MGKWDQREIWARKVSQALPDSKEPQARRVCLDHRVQWVLQESRAPVASLAFLEFQVLMDLLVILAKRVIQAPRETRVHLVHKELLAILGLEV